MYGFYSDLTSRKRNQNIQYKYCTRTLAPLNRVKILVFEFKSIFINNYAKNNVKSQDDNFEVHINLNYMKQGNYLGNLNVKVI